MYKFLVRPLLFLLPAENAHHFTFSLVRLIHKIPGVAALNRALFKVNDPRLERTFFGIKFPNPVGLAAGFDKDAKLYRELGNYGFGFIEIGTLTPKGQPGNPQPRLFRLRADEALINRMGFINGGVEEAITRLKADRGSLIVGGNIGKNKVTPNEEATEDYLKCFEALFPLVDYFVVNVSSPNTPNLRELQDREPLTKLLNALQVENKAKEKSKPILLKIAPDLTNEQLDDIVGIVADTGIDGLIATNTTIDRSGLTEAADSLDSIGAGGLSGKPVRSRSTEVIRYLHEKSNGAFPIIGVGGIYTAEDAIEKLKAGASLLQVYTGFIYEGPAMIKKINKGILKAEL